MTQGNVNHAPIVANPAYIVTPGSRLAPPTKDGVLHTLSMHHALFRIVLFSVSKQLQDLDALSLSTIVLADPAGVFVEEELVQWVEPLRNASAREDFLQELRIQQTHSLLKVSFEVVFDYCEKSKQLETFQSQPWYQFARIMRNSMSHERGGVVNRWPNNAPAKVSWRHKTLRRSEVGQQIAMSPLDCLRFAGDMWRFVDKQLS